MRTSKRFAVQAGAVLVMMCATGEAGAQTSSTVCSSVAYRGFDSRLRVEAVGRVQIQGEPVRGFEVADGRPVIAFERRLVAIDRDQLLVLPSIDRIDGLAVDADGGVWVQQATRLRRATKEKLEVVRTVAEGVRVHNSGHKLFLESETQGDATRLTIRTGDDRGALSPFHIDGGTPSAVSWNTVGAAAAVGDSLLTWTSAAKSISRLRTDAGLRNANDVALIAPDRVVVALQQTLALVAGRRATILALMKARVRWSGGALYVFEETSGVVWKLTGIESIGTADADKAHATKLLRELPAAGAESHVNFQEAARLVGCEGVKALRKRR
jgi:hypothetical protein